MIDEHAEIALDISELNKLKISENRWSIVQNRIMIVCFFTLLLALNIGGIIVLKHDIHDCEAHLYKKLTGTEIHRDLFVSQDTKNPIRKAD